MNFPTLARDFPFESEVVEIQSTTTIEEAIIILFENNILSVPVYNNKSKKYLGWFTISDLIPIFLTLDNLIKNLSNEQLTIEFINEIVNNFRYKENNIGNATTIEQCFNLKISNKIAWIPFNETSSMSLIIQSLNSNVKRVPIIDSNTGKCIKIISQNAIMKFMDEKIKEIIIKDLPLPPLFHREINSFDNVIKKVITVDHLTPVSDCLSLMIEYNYSAIGITNDDKMFLCITTKDLLKLKSFTNIAMNRLGIELKARDFEHGILDNEIEQLMNLNLGRALEDMSCADFVSFVRQSQNGAGNRNRKEKAAVIAVTPKNTLMKVIAKMSKSRVHRVFVCERKQALGVVSVRDIVRILFSQK